LVIGNFLEQLEIRLIRSISKHQQYYERLPALLLLSTPHARRPTIKFLAEGTDPAFSLTAFLAKSHRLGWRKFILYRTRGQRMISTAAMGNGDTDDVEMDV